MNFIHSKTPYSQCGVFFMPCLVGFSPHFKKLCTRFSPLRLSAFDSNKKEQISNPLTTKNKLLPPATAPRVLGAWLNRTEKKYKAQLRIKLGWALYFKGYKLFTSIFSFSITHPPPLPRPEYSGRGILSFNSPPLPHPEHSWQCAREQKKHKHI